MKILFRDRKTGELQEEKVYGKFFLELLYSNHFLSKFYALVFLPIITKVPLLSKLYGWKQKSRSSRIKILPFVEKFGIDSTEFEKPIREFLSFNDFFIRKLKSAARPIASDKHVAILPADGRYLVFPTISKADGFYVKGKKFDLGQLLQDGSLADQYTEGSLVIARRHAPRSPR